MRTRRRADSSNLAFLDIMSCGLGAAVLVFMLAKRNVDADTVVQAESLQEDVGTLEARKGDLEAALRQLVQAHAAEIENVQAIQDRLAEMKKMLAEKDADIAAAQRSLQALKKDLVATKVNKNEDLIALKGRGEEDYLMGLRVTGERIAVLLDSSASMAAARLIDVIKIKNSGRAEKKQARKWLRTTRILRWLLARLPGSSQVAVVSFSDTARVLGVGGWTAARGGAGLGPILADVDALLPEGATNLQAGLQAVNALRPSHLYVITDGLPTVGESRYAGLNPFSKCDSLLGRSTTISGECRVKLFRHTIQASGAGAATVNVILLPMEGDPQAANEYWAWAGQRGGLLISPAAGWP